MFNYIRLQRLLIREWKREQDVYFRCHSTSKVMQAITLELLVGTRRMYLIEMSYSEHNEVKKTAPCLRWNRDGIIE